MNNLQRRPYRYAIALVLACATLIALILVFLARSVPLSDKLTEIGTGLVASTIFALIYTALANREFSELIRAEIDSQLSHYTDDIMHSITRLNQLFLPTDQYPAAREFDPRFNRDLTRDLCSSSFYFFRGTNARYVPARLRSSSHHLDIVRVIPADPADRDAVGARVSDRLRRPEYAGKTITDIADEIRRELLLALIALFDCRELCDIEVGFTSTTSPVRIEIFDNAIYTSLYRSPESLRSTHPETARFDRESQTYQIFRDECRRHMQLARPRRRFTTRDTDDNLCEFLAELGFPEVSPEDLGGHRDRYQRLVAPFLEALATMGRAA